MKIRMAKYLNIEYPKIAFVPDLVSQQKREIWRLRYKPFAVNIKVINPNNYDNDRNIV